MKIIKWDKEKNKFLKKERDISFEDTLNSMENRQKYVGKFSL